MNNLFIYVIGIVAAVIGILSFAVLFCVWVYVRVLGFPLSLYLEKDKKDENQDSEESTESPS